MIEFVEADKPYGLFSGEFLRIDNWINSACFDFDKEVGEITIINCSDQYLLRVNIEHLQHNYYTDVITFDYVMGNIVSGDIFISEDRIIENAHNFNESQEREFLRVVIHGVLHLCGLGDKSDEEQILMREKENYYLNIFYQ